MEKLIYVVWKREEATPDGLRDELIGPLAAKLRDAGARQLVVSAADGDAAYAQASVISHMPDPISAVVCFWLDSHLEREPVEQLLRSATSRIVGYLALESVPIVNTQQRGEPGLRTPGITTIGFLEKPDRLSYDAWLELWQGQHTRVGIETQSTFLYVQNAVARALTPDAPPWVAIVEEGFPREALTDQKIFYAAGHSDAVLAENRGRMIESCRRFIEFDRLESHVFSQYVLGD